MPKLCLLNNGLVKRGKPNPQGVVKKKSLGLAYLWGQGRFTAINFK